MLVNTGIAFPRVALAEQEISTPRIDDVPGAILADLRRLAVAEEVRPAMRVTVTAGSRGIARIPTMLWMVVEELKRLRAVPLLVPPSTF